MGSYGVFSNVIAWQEEDEDEDEDDDDDDDDDYDDDDDDDDVRTYDITNQMAHGFVNRQLWFSILGICNQLF